MKERLQKIISGQGITSRRKAEQLIEAGKVTVNGITAHLGDTADLQCDRITVEGQLLKAAPAERICLMLNKPRGYVTTMEDEQGRPSVAELVQDCGCRVYPVGRLDMYSEGMLLLTNDGELANRLMHPRGEKEKVYHVWVHPVGEEAIANLREPIEIDGRRTRPAEVRDLGTERGKQLLEFRLREGRNRQIRRLCQRAEVKIVRLMRIQIGGLRMGALPVGTWRKLTPEEIQNLGV